MIVRAARYRLPVSDDINHLIKECIVHERVRAVSPIGTEDLHDLKDF